MTAKYRTGERVGTSIDFSGFWGSVRPANIDSRPANIDSRPANYKYIALLGRRNSPFPR